MRSPTPHRPRLARWLAAAVVAVCTAAGLTALTASPAAAVETNTWYRIVNDQSGLAVSIQNSATTAGALTVLATPSNATNQQFRFVDSGGGYYRIQARHSNQVLDVYAKSTANGADVVQWTDNNGTNQQWQVNDQSDGSVELVNRNSGKALDNWEGATAPGSRVSQYTRNNLETQHWKLVPVGTGGTAGNGSLTDANVQFYGRWDKDNATFYQMGWAGGYVETAFTGSSIGVRLRNTIDMWYSIDGGNETWMRNVSGNVTVRSGLSGTHTIRIGFRERAGSYTGDPSFGGFILASGGATSATVRPDTHIEFIGDSITVGQPNANRPFSTYAWNSAEAVGASHMQVAEGGACVSTTDCRGMVDWFMRTTNQDANDMWEFNTYETDLVVINLGTNNKVSAAQFQADYILLLQRVRQHYPNAEILAMGVFRERLLTEVQNAVANRNNAGDAKVHYVDTRGWVNPATDTSDNVHPHDAGHAKIAGLLTPVLRQYL
ncbi:RICIN domain-containing protein [Glycomyces sp. NPDC021274]|uniref:RICIN domain-containing protein n=1 Tax=Glycomyces sp. NPDC021274 TaxID=3155120 RepID=UPI0034115887